MPAELVAAVDKNVCWSDQQLISYRIAWCRKWVVRAKELEELEKEDAEKRSPGVQR